MSASDPKRTFGSKARAAALDRWIARAPELESHCPKGGPRQRAPYSGPSSDNRYARSHSRSNNHKAGSHRCNSHTATHNRQVAEAAGLHRPPEVRAHCPRWLQYRTPPDRHPQRLHFPLGLELAEPTRPSLLHRQWRQESSCTLHESLKLGRSTSKTILLALPKSH